jgi:hypothetical protein
MGSTAEVECDAACMEIAKIANPHGHSRGGMNAASVGYVTMAFFNWILMFGKLFYWFWFGIGITPFTNLLDALATEDVNTVTNIQNALTDLIGVFTWPTPAGLMWGMLINNLASFWLMVYFRDINAWSDPGLGAYMRAATGFFWVWWILGAGQPALLYLDYLYGSKSWHFDNHFTRLTLFSAIEYGVTIIVLTACREPLFAMYNTV